MATGSPSRSASAAAPQQKQSPRVPGGRTYAVVLGRLEVPGAALGALLDLTHPEEAECCGGGGAPVLALPGGRAEHAGPDAQGLHQAGGQEQAPAVGVAVAAVEGRLALELQHLGALRDAHHAGPAGGGAACVVVGIVGEVDAAVPEKGVHEVQAARAPAQLEAAQLLRGQAASLRVLEGDGGVAVGRRRVAAARRLGLRQHVGGGHCQLIVCLWRRKSGAVPTFRHEKGRRPGSMSMCSLKILPPRWARSHWHRISFEHGSWLSGSSASGLCDISPQECASAMPSIQSTNSIFILITDTGLLRDRQISSSPDLAPSHPPLTFKDKLDILGSLMAQGQVTHTAFCGVEIEIILSSKDGTFFEGTLFLPCYDFCALII
ncbi:uncharacterized protein LOC103660103 [Ursus maritimus]|uniref:Uncharacterized protein LOC103660103 n=1 Tax=Ursus maritimus TaxID=29073 RepID=A0A8M1GDL5_URSMA|nr:uncharacterized protein LOC103660103 [Ursus maritimus]